MTPRRAWAVLAALWLAASPAFAGESKFPVVPGGLSLPASPAERALPAVPELPAGAVVPELPASAIPEAPAPEVELLRGAGAAAVPASPTAWTALEGLTRELAARPEAAQASSDGAFDGAGRASAPSSPLPAPALPRLPEGVLSVRVHEVRAAADVRAAIPADYERNTNGWLAGKLAETVENMAPYLIYDYKDRLGGRFIAIDLSRKPELVDLLPEQQSHEVRLIKKIQALNLDLQVVLREEGATPDLIVGGVLTELKTRLSPGIHLGHLLDKANGQVAAHAQKHGLGLGAVAVDLAREEGDVPIHEVSLEIANWAQKTRSAGRAIALKKIFVFAGDDLKEFILGPGGSVVLSDAAVMPLRARPPPATRRGAKKPAPKARQWRPAEVEALLGRMIRHRHYRSALRLWARFSREAPAEDVFTVGERVGDLLTEAESKLRSSHRGGR